MTAALGTPETLLPKQHLWLRAATAPCWNAGAGMLPGSCRGQLCLWNQLCFLQDLWCFVLCFLPSAEPIRRCFCHPELGAFWRCRWAGVRVAGYGFVCGFCSWMVVCSGFLLKCGEGGKYKATTLSKLSFGRFILLGFILTFQMNDAFKLVESWGCVSLGDSENRYLCRWEWCVHATIHHCLTPDVKHFTVPSA